MKDQVQQDIKNNRVKQGFLLTKMSKDQQWNKKWVVLTKNYLYIFDNNNIHHRHLQKIALKEVQFICAFFVNQDNQSHVLSIQFNQKILLFSALSNNEKRTWVFAIQRTIQILQNPDIQDSKSLLRDLLKKSTGLLYEKSQRKSTLRLSSLQQKPKKHKKIQKYNKIVDQKILPHSTITKITQYNNLSYQQWIKNGNTQFNGYSSSIIVNSKMIELNSKIIQRVIIERMIQIVGKGEEKKIINLNISNNVYQCSVNGSPRKNKKQLDQQPPQDEQNPVESLFQLFQYIINNRSVDPKPIISFIAYLGTSQVQKLQLISLQFCFYGENNRFFIQLLLQILNEEIDEDNLNRYTAFIYILYKKDSNFFYKNDLKLLIEIIIRQIQMYRSDLNQLINLQMISALAIRNGDIVAFRKTQIASLIAEIIDVGNEYNQSIAKSIYQLII